MKITNTELINAYLGLNFLGKEKLPIMLSHQIESIRSYLEPYAKTVDNMILEIKKKYAAVDPASGDFVRARSEQGDFLPNTLILENAEEANKEINEFLIQELEIPEVFLKLSEFPSSFTISADNLKLIKRIIKL
jgi:hypothetical protein